MLKNKIAVYLLFAINGLLCASYTTRFPELQQIHGLDAQAIGFNLFSIALGALIAMPFIGMVMVRKSSARIATMSALSYCLLLPFIGFAGHFWALIFVFFIIGLATGAMDVAMNAQAIHTEKEAKKSLISSFHAMFSGGMMLGAGLGTLFIKYGFSISEHMLIISVLSGILLVWCSRNLLISGTQKAEVSQKFKIPNFSLISIGIIAFCSMLGEGAMANWSTIYMVKIVHAGTEIAPLALAAFSFSMMLTRLWGDFIRNKWPDKYLMIANGIIAVIGLMILLIFPIPLAAIFGFFLIGVGLSTIVPIVYSTAGNLPEYPSSIGLGLVTTFGYAGLLLGPTIIGTLSNFYNLKIAMIFTLFLFALMILLSVKVIPKKDN